MLPVLKLLLLPVDAGSVFGLAELVLVLALTVSVCVAVATVGSADTADPVAALAGGAEALILAVLGDADQVLAAWPSGGLLLTLRRPVRYLT